MLYEVITGEDVADTHARVERSVGILEHDLLTDGDLWEVADVAWPAATVTPIGGGAAAVKPAFPVPLCAVGCAGK